MLKLLARFGRLGQIAPHRKEDLVERQCNPAVKVKVRLAVALVTMLVAIGALYHANELHGLWGAAFLSPTWLKATGFMLAGVFLGLMSVVYARYGVTMRHQRETFQDWLLQRLQRLNAPGKYF